MLSFCGLMFIIAEPSEPRTLSSQNLRPNWGSSQQKSEWTPPPDEKIKFLSPPEQIFQRAAPEELNHPLKFRTAIWEEQNGGSIQVGDFALYYMQDAVEQIVTSQGRKPSVLIAGANNGVLVDRLFPIIVAHEWEGILFEPVPSIYEDLVNNYKKKLGHLWTGLHLENMAITEEAGSVKMWIDDRAPNGGDRPDWKRGTGSLLRHKDEQGYREIAVKSDRLDAILLDRNVKNVDIIQIDVEGHDLMVLRQVADMMRKGTIKPYLVCLEDCNEECQAIYKEFQLKVINAPGQVCGYRIRVP